MKKLLSILFLINFQSLFSQQHLIEYELTPRPIPVVEINKNSEYVRYHNSTTMKTLMYFDNDSFHFLVNPEEFQNTTNKKINDKEYILILSIYRETYYNKNTDILCLKRIVQNEFGCEKQPKYQWNLTNETSTINGFKVYKAYIDEPYITRKGVERINQIIAWYCPDLPYNYAPMGIGGLPGLVLSLETHGSKYVAKKITLNHSKEKVKSPKEYDEFVKNF